MPDESRILAVLKELTRRQRSEAIMPYKGRSLAVQVEEIRKQRDEAMSKRTRSFTRWISDNMSSDEREWWPSRPYRQRALREINEWNSMRTMPPEAADHEVAVAWHREYTERWREEG